MKVYVTGGAGGIGLAVVEKFLANGADVAFCDKDEQQVEALLSKYKNSSSKLIGRVLDVADSEKTQGLISEAISIMGGLDCLISNAGIVLPEPAEHISENSLDECLAVNLRTPILASKVAIPALKESANASICYMSSEAAHTGYPNIGVYSATKGGLSAMARCMAIELSTYGIRVNSVSPGLTKTGMVDGFAQLASDDPEAYLKALSALQPSGRLNEANEVASVVCFLASEDAKRITGHDLRVDGGTTVMGHFLGAH